MRTSTTSRDYGGKLGRASAPSRTALIAGTDPAEMVERIDAGIVPVRPVDANRVAAHGFHFIHPQLGFVHRKQFTALVIGLLRRRAVGSCAGGAGAFVAQVGYAILAMMQVFPVDLDAFGLGNRDVLGLVGRVTHGCWFSLIDSLDVAHA